MGYQGDKKEIQTQFFHFLIIISEVLALHSN